MAWPHMKKGLEGRALRSPAGEPHLNLILKGTGLQKGGRGEGRQIRCALCPFYLSTLKFYDSPSSMGPCHLPQSLPAPRGGPLCSPSSPVALSTLQGPPS